MATPARAATPAKTFANPLNLDYGFRSAGRSAVPHRHGADPVIVLFKDRYYLFSTWDKPGYRVSDDLVNWSYIPFDGSVQFERGEGHYTAAAVEKIGDWLYFFELSRKPVKLYRTKDPASGEWETVTEIGPYADPCLFVDPPTGRVFVYSGLEKPTHGVELDRTTFQPIPGTDTQLMPAFDPKRPIENGWEVCTWDNAETSPGMRGNKTFFPCREGSWMTYHDGTYYLQFASPGTTVPGYADGVLTGKNPLGPFEYSQHSPISQKDSGFITSAGHSCLFQDRHGNGWRVVTMLIGAHERFERRIGLFPAGFDKDGVLYTRTDLGDVPYTLPDGKRDHLGDVHAGWMVLSQGKTVTASSSLDDHPAKLASDEDVRTWWAAKTGGADEWLQVDLGAIRDVRAIQVNLYEQDVKAPPKDADDYHRFVVSASQDGGQWAVVADRSNGETATPHFYAELEKPARARYLKVQNVATPGGGKFAVSDLRAFGLGDGARPGSVTEVVAKRDATDRRKVTVTWKPVDGAAQYQVRYGIDPGKLYHHYLVKPGAGAELTMYNLNARPGYFFTVDAMNEAGVTEAAARVEAP
jgi:hypothetical protein